MICYFSVIPCLGCFAGLFGLMIVCFDLVGLGFSGVVYFGFAFCWLWLVDCFCFGAWFGVIIRQYLMGFTAFEDFLFCVCFRVCLIL